MWPPQNEHQVSHVPSGAGAGLSLIFIFLFMYTHLVSTVLQDLSESGSSISATGM